MSRLCKKIFRVVKNTNHFVDGYPIYYLLENTDKQDSELCKRILDEYDYRSISEDGSYTSKPDYVIFVYVKQLHAFLRKHACT